jgi:RNA polymerase sigma factor (sigma-70 family)
MSKDTTDRNTGAAETGCAAPVNSRRGPDSTGRIREDAAVTDLVAAAQQGDQEAWDALVARYLALVLAVARAYRLRDKDAADLSQFVWLHLVEQLARIREPSALPKWIVAAARHESQRLAAARTRTNSVHPLVEAKPGTDRRQAEVADGLRHAEERQALRDGLAELPVAQRELLLLLTADPPLSHRHISRVLNIPVGSIGQMRSRMLQQLRATSALRPFLVSPSAATPTTTRARHTPAA